MILLQRSWQARGRIVSEPQGRLRDSHGRAITDLRISVTDRCNYKCVYCRTGNEGAQFTELPIADYLRMIRVFVSLGIEKVRLTGGEPLLRSGLVEMVQELAQMRTAYADDGTELVPGDPDAQPLDIALTTNGHLLAGLAAPLKAAGLSRITVSMDAVDPETFARITRVPRSFERVLAGIRAAREAGLGPVKVNCVLLRGFNDSQIEQFAEFSRQESVIVRFIEWMPLEEDRSWKPETVVTLDEIVTRLNAVSARSSTSPPTPPARPRAATPSTTASARSASSRPSPTPSAATAAASASPPTARSAPASSRRATTICTVCCTAAEATRTCMPTSAGSSCGRRPATTSASPTSRSRPATWCTSAVRAK